MSDKTLADLFAAEPPDGTHLVAWEDDTQPFVVWRDDVLAQDLSNDSTKRWFAGEREEPMTFELALSGATMVHAVVPLAQSGLVLVDEGES